MKFYNYLFPFIISCFFVSGSFAATEEKSYGPTGKEYAAHFGQSLAVCTSQGSGECPSGEICGYGGSNTSCIEAMCVECSENQATVMIILIQGRTIERGAFNIVCQKM